MQFTVSLYPDQVHYVDIILGTAADLVQKFKATGGLACHGMAIAVPRGTNLSEKAEDQIGELLPGPLRSGSALVLDLRAGPMKTLGLGVLKNLGFGIKVSNAKDGALRSALPRV